MNKHGKIIRSGPYSWLAVQCTSCEYGDLKNSCSRSGKNIHCNAHWRKCSAFGPTRRRSCPPTQPPPMIPGSEAGKIVDELIAYEKTNCRCYDKQRARKYEDEWWNNADQNWQPR